MSDKSLLGLMIGRVTWTPAEAKNGACYFITTSDGRTYEVLVEGLRPCELPAAHHTLEPVFREILAKGRIADIRTDDASDLAILLDTGHIMLLIGTFDGTDTGNNFYLQSPAEVAEWSQEFLEMRPTTSPVR